GRDGFEKMLRVYPILKNFVDTIDQLKTQTSERSPESGEMEFDKTTWDYVVKPLFGYTPTAVGGMKGPFVPENLTFITQLVAHSITELSGAPSALDPKWPQENVAVVTAYGWGELYYNQCAVDQDLRAPIEKMVKLYRDMAIFLGDYREVECDGEGCPLFGDEISLKDAERIKLSIRSDKNNFLMVHNQPSIGAWCFSGDQFLRTSNGSTISFEQLDQQQTFAREAAARGVRQEQSSPLQSYDECGPAGPNDSINQQPTKVWVHKKQFVKLMHLKLKAQDGAVVELKVTENHPLLAKKFGGERWTPAGELQDGDILLGPDGVELSVDKTATQIEEGVFTLYNLSFAQPDLHPTYSVSPDGKHWIWVHNK
ncbi:MAG: Hint domain-containing protein, partial [Deltaproteobacteria bacterium]|nr:Hint domain-containing protein [Deltaproteobacteria bacterium]